MRTIIYIDGLNLYYRALKDTPYKWLDLQKLSSEFIPDTYKIIEIKYFTTRVKPLPHDVDAPKRQNIYLRALRAHSACINIFYGHFTHHNVRMRKVKPPPNTVEVIKTEEKGSDVNLAVHLLNDAWLDKYDCAVLISNDSDMAEALSQVRRHHENKIIYLINPSQIHPTSRKLLQYATHTREIRTPALKKSQLPDSIPNTKITKPQNWYRQND